LLFLAEFGLQTFEVDRRIQMVALVALAILGSLTLGLLIVRAQKRRIDALLNGVGSLRDGDFSLRLASVKGQEYAEIMDLFNQMAEILQIERREHYQKELLLETVLTHTETAFIITNPLKRILFANRVAKSWVPQQGQWEGVDFDELLTLFPNVLSQALTDEQSGIVQVTSPRAGSFHTAHRVFELNQQPHHLYIIRDVTTDLTRQEIAIWKKVLRLVNHELNNSLTPISSLFHTARIYLDKEDPKEKLLELFDIIQQRLENLKAFLTEYAQFARLPAPDRQPTSWKDFLNGMLPLARFRLKGKPPDGVVCFDPLQMKQVLINLHKNALEAGSDTDEIELHIHRLHRGQWMIRILDRGHGMTEDVLQQALLPFFSTRRDGSGLGLALCREIIEAHQGTLNLRNRDKGLEIQIVLPDDGELSRH